MAKEPLGRNENGYVIHPERKANSSRPVRPLNWLFYVLEFLIAFGILFTTEWYLVHQFIAVSLSPWVLACVALFGSLIVVGLRPQ